MHPTVAWHPVLESTNSYLLRKFEAGENLPNGCAVAALRQTAGRGQRGRIWEDLPGESLLLSVGGQPAASLNDLALYSFGLAVGIAETLEALLPGLAVQLKWPNDLYVKERKLGGILIENVLRGMAWPFSVVGVGINVGQRSFPESMAHRAISLQQAVGGNIPSLELLAEALRERIATCITEPLPDEVLHGYNKRLFRKGQLQDFETQGIRWQGRVVGALADGRLQVQTPEGLREVVHGIDEWISG